jgi:acetoin utilization deacetylase AcuC-like enzyme
VSVHYYTHADCLAHEMQPGHPERPDRLRAVQARLEEAGLTGEMRSFEAREAAATSLALAHEPAHLRRLESLAPAEGLVAVDPDTAMCPGSLRAARLAAGAVAAAAEDVLDGRAERAFCAVRPPGHHAEADVAMGFCLYNSIAVGALTALARPEVERVAVLDFDVHHGNGTVDIFKNRPEVLVCSSFQHPFYPHRYGEIERPNIVNTPLPAGTGSSTFRAALERDWLPALERHAPQIIFVSAGFDAHRDDPLAGLELTEDDFRWVTRLIRNAADRFARGRIVSALEGGYDLSALAASVEAHVSELVA